MADGRVVTVPETTVRVDLGQGLEVREGASWSVSRSLSGGGLPGQARAVSGSSVGTGSVELAAPKGGSPWATSASMPGGAAEIDVTHDVEGWHDGGPVTYGSLARMRVRSISRGSMLSSARSLEVEDRTPQGPVSIPALTSIDSADAAGVVDWAARQAGYFATQPPTPETILSVPLCGALWPEQGRYASTIAGTPAFGEHRGRVMLAGDTPLYGPSNNAVTLGMDFGFTAVVDSGDAYFAVWESTFEPRILFQVTPGQVLVNFRAGGSAAISTSTTGAHLYEGIYLGSQFHIYKDRTLIGSITGMASDLFTEFVTAVVSCTGGALTSGFFVDRRATPRPWYQPTAQIGTASSPLAAILPTSGTAWSTIQDVASSTLGAVWIDEDGHLIYRGRDAMRGGAFTQDIHGGPATVDVIDDAADLPWSLSIDEVADRVEVTYQAPVIVTSSTGSATVWESTDQVRVNAGQTVTIVQDLEVAAYSPVEWLRVEDVSTYPIGQRSRYAALTTPAGESGTVPPAAALDVRSSLLTPTRLRITIRNTTGSPLWIYQLTARALSVASPGEPRTLSTGLPEEQARSPLTVNLGTWVQDEATAHEILAWLTGTTTTPLPIIGPVSVAPDSDRRLGDIVRVRLRSALLEADGSPVEAWTTKALVSGIQQSGSPGSFTQQYTLTALSPTEGDLARYMTAQGLATEADWAAHLTALGLTTEADLAAWITRGGLYA